jgi:hypothetical protein
MEVYTIVITIVIAISGYIFTYIMTRKQFDENRSVLLNEFKNELKKDFVSKLTNATSEYISSAYEQFESKLLIDEDIRNENNVNYEKVYQISNEYSKCRILLLLTLPNNDDGRMIEDLVRKIDNSIDSFLKSPLDVFSGETNQILVIRNESSQLNAMNQVLLYTVRDYINKIVEYVPDQKS